MHTLNTIASGEHVVQPVLESQRINRMVRISFADQVCLVEVTNNTDGYVIAGPFLSPSMAQRLLEARAIYPDARAIRVDNTDIGSYALFSVADYGMRELWRSDQLVETVESVILDTTVASTVELVQNY